MITASETQFLFRFDFEILLGSFIASTDRTHSTDSSGRVDTADSNDGNVGAGSIEGVDSINTMTVLTPWQYGWNWQYWQY